MMGVLKWVRQSQKDNPDECLCTALCDYEVFLSTDKWRVWASVGDWEGKRFDSSEAAKSACESDYIARCSEFLPVAGPGECVVKVEDVLAIKRALEEYRKAEENSGKPYPRTPDWMFPLRGLTAAIHAFTHPVHLHTYDPQTQVVIKREDILKIFDGNCGECTLGLRKPPPCDACCMAAIRTAALEVKP